jgi:hypothetical protein
MEMPASITATLGVYFEESHGGCTLLRVAVQHTNRRGPLVFDYMKVPAPRPLVTQYPWIWRLCHPETASATIADAEDGEELGSRPTTRCGSKIEQSSGSLQRRT